MQILEDKITITYAYEIVILGYTQVCFSQPYLTYEPRKSQAQSKPAFEGKGLMYVSVKVAVGAYPSPLHHPVVRPGARDQGQRGVLYRIPRLCVVSGLCFPHTETIKWRDGSSRSTADGQSRPAMLAAVMTL